MIYNEFENSEERLIRMLPDNELSVPYREKWGIVGEYIHGHYAFCDDEGNEVNFITLISTIMELECPACGSYDCHFDGLHFVCEDCGHAWGGYCPGTECDD